MKIQYRKKHLNHSLIFGLFWLIMGLIGVFFKDAPYWTDFSFLFIALLYLGSYFYGKANKYLTIENGQISMNKPFGKKMALSDIKQVKKIAGDYILKTDNKELTINTKIIEENSLAELNRALEKLELN